MYNKGIKEEKEYFAFISYKSEDLEWAMWLQHELEHYRLPASFNGRTDIRQELRPVFRDIDELSAGNLPEQIKQALENSQNLIVVCSPQAAVSHWVNKEVETFISLGRTDRIFPFIVEGNSPKEFFPPSLLALPENEERLGGDASKHGRDIAFVKVVAGILGLGFDSLWNRYEKEKAEEERRQREEKEKLQKTQSRFIAEKVVNLVNEGNLPLAKLLALEVLPKDLVSPNRPYVAEAEMAMRYALKNRKAVIQAHKSSICSAFFIYNGTCIVTASYDNSIRFWDVRTHLPIKHAIEGDTQEKDINGFVSVTPGQDGALLVTTSLSDAIQIWDVDTGSCLWKVKNKSIFYRYAVLSPSGDEIAATSLNSIVEIWSVKKRKCMLKMEGHTDKVFYIAYNLDGSKIVSASWDTTIRIWDVKTGACDKILIGHKGKVNMAIFSPNEKIIVSASDDKTIRIWDSCSGKCENILEGHANSVKTIAFNSDGTKVISTSLDGTVRIWDLQNNGICVDYIMPIKGNYSTTAASFGPNDRHILVSYDNGMLVIMAKNDDSIVTLNGHSKEVVSALYSNDGRYIVSASWDKTVGIWDGHNGKLLHKLIGHSGDILFAVFSPNGKQVASASRDRTVRVWDSTSGECLHIYYGHQDEINSVCYSSDGQYLLSSSRDNTIRLWEVMTGNCIRTIDTSPNHALLITIDSKDKHIIASMNNYDLSIWNLQSGEPMPTCEEDRDKLIHFLLTPDRNYIVGTTTGENVVQVWDRKSKQCVQSYIGHTQRVWSFAFNPAGDKVVSASSDHTIKIWDFPPLQTIISNTRNCYKDRQLTVEEREQYYFE